MYFHILFVYGGNSWVMFPKQAIFGNRPIKLLNYYMVKIIKKDYI
jgi:hypothetical protein